MARAAHSSGNYAVYRGVAYHAYGDSISARLYLAREPDDPIPEGLPEDPTAPGRVYITTPEDVEEWYETRWTFKWHDEPFDAMSSGHGIIGGWYTGQRLHLIADHLTQEDQSGWSGRFPLDEVTDLTEHRRDLMAKWKEKHSR